MSDEAIDSARKALLYMGTAGWSYKDWGGHFYREGIKPADMLEEYQLRYRCVEIDSSFYAIPPKRNIDSWKRRSRPGFLFAPKFPQVISHEKFLSDCDEELEVFLERVQGLGEHLGPLLLQFPYFNMKSGINVMGFVGRLSRFLKLFEAKGGKRLAVEVRNKTFLRAPLLDLLRDHRVPLVALDHPWMPTPQSYLGAEELRTGDFAYLRLLGDRYGIEKITKTWNRTVLDQGWRLDSWARWIREQVAEGEVWVFANNHFAGFAPATVEALKERLA
jgi:uncharacterized protein YecE (DUF72 family)